MNCNEAISYIRGLTKRGIVPGLTAQKRLLEKLGNPHLDLPVIHIAGTNGKGSVGAYLSSVLASDNKHVCRFISPCVGDWRNTFLVDSVPAGDELLTECVAQVKDAITQLEAEGVYPTSFEAETATAFLMFNKISPDYAIIECGMGGRLDATNVVEKPILSVITKIAYDHTAFLGDTISDIAFEKAGIIKEGVPVVTTVQDPNAAAVIQSVAASSHAPLYIADIPKNVIYADTYTEFISDGTQYKTRLLGTYQPQNASIAIKCAEVLGIGTAAIEKGIENARWQYRFERIGKFILDGAHNPDGAESLNDSLKIYTTPENTAFICACFKDKEYDELARITHLRASRVFCVKAPTERGLDAEVLADAFIKHGTDAVAVKSLHSAIKLAEKYENVVIFGTLSILDDAKQIIEGTYNYDSLQQNI